MYSNDIQKRHAALSTCSASHAAGRVGCDDTTCSGARQSAATLRARAATTARAEGRRPLERGGARQTKVASTGARARGRAGRGQPAEPAPACRAGPPTAGTLRTGSRTPESPLRPGARVGTGRRGAARGGAGWRTGADAFDEVGGSEVSEELAGPAEAEHPARENLYVLVNLNPFVHTCSHSDAQTHLRDDTRTRGHTDTRTHGHTHTGRMAVQCRQSYSRASRPPTLSSPVLTRMIVVSPLADIGLTCRAS